MILINVIPIYIRTAEIGSSNGAEALLAVAGDDAVNDELALEVHGAGGLDGLGAVEGGDHSVDTVEGRGVLLVRGLIATRNLLIALISVLLLVLVLVLVGVLELHVVGDVHSAIAARKGHLDVTGLVVHLDLSIAL